MNSSVLLRLRAATRVMTTTRAFSNECAPAQKLRFVFEEYRREHFSRELPSRFRKEIAKVMQGGTENEVAVDNINIVLGNIGRQDAFLTEQELADLLREAGATSRKIPLDQAMQFI